MIDTGTVGREETPQSEALLAGCPGMPNQGCARATQELWGPSLRPLSIRRHAHQQRIRHKGEPASISGPVPLMLIEPWRRFIWAPERA